jgi:type III secretion protein V
MAMTKTGTAKKVDSARNKLGFNAELALVVLVIAILALMIVPLPEWLLDAAIAINLAVSIALLLYAMTAQSTLSLSTFPTLLLVTTLARIAINVATTKQILMYASGGDIIAAFGRLVVGGNVVVGLIVFGVLTIVQFIVVAKGAERVAEVAARFTLDGLPGKQLSIDSDLRAGLISEAEASQRRHSLEKESRVYGAMDGAMKFVKGDAIAGLIIVLINLLGGLVIGIAMHGMDSSTALSTYSVLSIGDGLVSQIPALFVSLAAGMLVTRTSGERGDTLANEIGAQIKASPRALMMAGAATMFFALIPGFPFTVFAAVSVALFAFGYLLRRNEKRMMKKGQIGLKALARDGSNAAPLLIDDSSNVAFAPLLIEVHEEIVPLLNGEVIKNELDSMRRRLSGALGIPFPGIRFRVLPNAQSGSYRISISEVPVASGVVVPGASIALAGQTALAQHGIAVITGQPKPYLGDAASWIEEPSKAQCALAGIGTWDCSQLLIHHIETAFMVHPQKLFGLQECQHVLKSFGQEYPDLVQELNKVVTLPRITRILQALVAEGLSIRNLRDIVSAILASSPNDANDADIVASVRFSLREQISFRCASGGTVRAVVFSPESEAGFEAQADCVDAHEVRQRTLQTLKDRIMLLNQRGVDVAKVVLLVGPATRAAVRAATETDIPWLQVVSYKELIPTLKVETVGAI